MLCRLKEDCHWIDLAMDRNVAENTGKSQNHKKKEKNWGKYGNYPEKL